MNTPAISNVLFLSRNIFTGAYLLKDSADNYLGTFNDPQGACDFCRDMGYTLREVK
jgi:hypothetical protein